MSDFFEIYNPLKKKLEKYLAHVVELNKVRMFNSLRILVTKILSTKIKNITTQTNEKSDGKIFPKMKNITYFSNAERKIVNLFRYSIIIKNRISLLFDQNPVEITIKS